MTNTKGETITSQALKGKITVIDFWEESCHPCVALFGFFNNLHSKYKDNPALQLFSFSGDSKEKAKNVIENHNLLFDVSCIEKNEINRLNYGTGYPAVLIVDADGIVVNFITHGFQEKGETAMEIENQINELLQNLSSTN